MSARGHDRDPRGDATKGWIAGIVESPAAGRNFPSRGMRATDRPPGVERGRVAEPRRQGGWKRASIEAFAPTKGPHPGRVGVRGDVCRTARRLLTTMTKTHGANAAFVIRPADRLIA